MMARIKDFLTKIRWGVPRDPLDPAEHERLKKRAEEYERYQQAVLSAVKTDVESLRARRQPLRK